MKIFTKIADLRQELKIVQAEAKTLGLVPTMGALHSGHMYLVQEARKVADYSIVSIFVNPKQFGEGEDFDAYPRTLEADLALLKENQVDFVFAPELEEMWPAGADTFVEVPNLSDILQGAARPGHFRGVTSVVAKLFNIIEPDFAFFGEKDFQQLTILRKMVADLNFPVQIIGVPTQREADGLACSSRNQLLTNAERQAAPILYKAIQKSVQAVDAGERDSVKLIEIMKNLINTEPLATIEHIELLDIHTLKPVKTMQDSPVVALFSVKFGEVRLLDQHVYQLI